MREQHGVRDADIARADHRDSFCRAGLRRGEIGHYRSCRCWGQPPLAATGGPLNSSCRSSPAEGRIRTEILRRGSCEIMPFGALGIGVPHALDQLLLGSHLAALRGVVPRLYPMLAHNLENVTP